MFKKTSRARLNQIRRKLLLERLEDRIVFSGFGPLDGAYIVEPWLGSYEGVQIQPSDQAIVAAGTMKIVNPNASIEQRIAIARFDAQGTADVTYGSGGVSAPALGSKNEAGQDVVLQSNGMAIVSGKVTSPLTSTDVAMGVARFAADGSIDSSFGVGGLSTLDVRSSQVIAENDYTNFSHLGLQADGKIVLTGTSPTIYSAGLNDPAVLGRFTTSGAVDAGAGGFGTQSLGSTLSYFGPYDTNQFNDLVMQSDDRIVAAGHFRNSFGSTTLLVARYSTNGLLDTSFNGSGYFSFLPAGATTMNASSVAQQPDDKILVAGSMTGIDAASDLFVARFNTNGTFDSSFGQGLGYVHFDVDGTATVTSEGGGDHALQPDGKIVVAGTLSATGAPNQILVARFNANGSRDFAFGAGGFKIGTVPSGPDYHSFEGAAVALQSDSSIIVAGTDRWNAADSNSYHPLLMRFSGASTPTPTALVSSAAGLITTEAGGQAAFTLVLDSQPAANVSIPISSSDTTEGVVSTSNVTFTAANWNVPQSITITGVNDALNDGNINFSIILGKSVSTDPSFHGFSSTYVSVTNIDNETKFYVVNDASTNRTYEYANGGASVENYALNSGNATPRGAASTAAGNKVWVIDNNRKVYVYNASGGLLGSWTAGSMASNATPQGIATNGTDVWIVDSKTDKVFKYSGAATRTSGSQNAASSFLLTTGNTNPTDIVTDGASLWVVNDSTTDKVYKYTVAGEPVGNWTIDPDNSSPTGITIDPTNVSDIWIADAGTDKIYQYTAVANVTSGSRGAIASYALAAGNTNPQGIADPPTPSKPLVPAALALADDASLQLATPQNVSSSNALSMASGIDEQSSPRLTTSARNVDAWMDRLGRDASSVPAATPVATMAATTQRRVSAARDLDFESLSSDLDVSFDLIARDLMEMQRSQRDK